MTIVVKDKYKGMTVEKSTEIDSDAMRMASTLLLLMRALDQQLRHDAPGDQLSLSELTVLRQVELGNDLPSSIARARRLDAGRVTRITDRLVALGYLERVLDASDRRRCRLRLTEPGRARLDDARVEISGWMASLLQGLSAEERTSLARGLEAVRRALDLPSEDH